MRPLSSRNPSYRRNRPEKLLKRLVPHRLAGPELVRQVVEAGGLERHSHLETCLEVLTERERLALLLRDVEDLPAEQVAEQLRCSKATVRSHIANARVKLRQQMERMKRKGIA